jgi:SAM-dependent methyltransferase
MISTNRCIVCGARALAYSPGRIAPFIAHRCRIDPAARVRRAWCPRCDLLFFDQRLDGQEVLRLYAHYRDAAYVAERSRFEPGYAERHPGLVDPADPVQRNRVLALRDDWDALSRPPSAPLRILDYGGGDGWLTRGAFLGAELTVFDLDVGSAEPPHGVFDLVVCAHVLEHVSFPLPFLAGLLPLMRPQGLLYLEVPGPGQRPPGTDVFDYMGPALHEHVSFFTGRAVLRLLRRLGLEPVQFLAVKEVTRVFAQPARVGRRPGPLPPPVRGVRGSDSLGAEMLGSGKALASRLLQS